MGICRRDFMRSAIAGLSARVLRGAITRPKLLVLVVLEQINGDALVGLVPRFTQNGFRKLLYEGAHFPACRHLASTFTSSSLATLATGAWPAEHGIVADSWFQDATVTPASAEMLLATT